MPSYRPEVDHVLLNGKIVTVDRDFTIAEAVAIRDGRIAAVGTTDEIRALAGSHTRTDDLAGGTVLPGIIDAHNHLLSTSQVLQQIQLYDCRSIDEDPGTRRRSRADDAVG